MNQLYTSLNGMLPGHMFKKKFFALSLIVLAVSFSFIKKKDSAQAVQTTSTSTTGVSTAGGTTSIGIPSIPGAGSGSQSIGPVQIYFSEQDPKYDIFTGGTDASADEGRVIDVNVSEITGPILVSPQNFHLDGPPCPTYDANGRRTPETVATPTTITFSGTIKLDPSAIPARGSSANGSLKGKDEGHWTNCATGEQHTYSQVVTVSFVIKNINLKISPENQCVTKGQNGLITVTEIFPKTGGKVTWTSLKGKVKATGNNSKCTLTFVAEGEDQVVATLTAGDVTFSDTVKVYAKGSNLAFKDDEYPSLIYDGNIALAGLLKANAPKTNLEWTASKNGAAERALDGDAPNLPIAGHVKGDVELITVKVKGTDCKISCKVKFYDIIVFSTSAKNQCDGLTFSFQVGLDPAGDAVRSKLLSRMTEVKSHSEPKETSKGNPAGTTDLPFKGMSATWVDQITKMIWYSTEDNHCNKTSKYNLWIDGKTDGKVVSTAKIEISADAAGGCVNGQIAPVDVFTGDPTYETGQDDKGWWAAVKDVGSFKRTPKGGKPDITTVANSQYYKMTVDEEDYHGGQFSGANGKLCDDMWLVKNVLDPMLNKKYHGKDEATAKSLCANAFQNRKNAEIGRCNALYNNTGSVKRCALEKEAKDAVGSTYIVTLKCAYKKCN